MTQRSSSYEHEQVLMTSRIHLWYLSMHVWGLVTVLIQRSPKGHSLPLPSMPKSLPWSFPNQIAHVHRPAILQPIVSSFGPVFTPLGSFLVHVACTNNDIQTTCIKAWCPGNIDRSCHHIDELSHIQTHARRAMDLELLVFVNCSRSKAYTILVWTRGK